MLYDGKVILEIWGLILYIKHVFNVPMADLKYIQGVPKKIGFSEMRHFIYKLPKTFRLVLMIRKFKTSLLRTFKFIV